MAYSLLVGRGRRWLGARGPLVLRPLRVEAVAHNVSSAPSVLGFGFGSGELGLDLSVFSETPGVLVFVFLHRFARSYQLFSGALQVHGCEVVCARFARRAH